MRLGQSADSPRLGTSALDRLRIAASGLSSTHRSTAISRYSLPRLFGDWYFSGARIRAMDGARHNKMPHSRLASSAQSGCARDNSQ